LQIVWVRAVLDKANDAVTDVDLVAADNCWRPFSMGSAFD
jgi:hypothetical protein